MASLKILKHSKAFFVHANQLSEPIKENDKVSFLAEHGLKGLNAVNVKK